MQTLNSKEVAAAARQLYESNMLTAQLPTRLGCTYLQSNGCRCAIGAGMTEETLSLIAGRNMNEKLLHTLFDGGVLGLPSPVEQVRLIHMQMLHDKWHSAAFSKSADFLVAEARRRFLAYIDELIADGGVE